MAGIGPPLAMVDAMRLGSRELEYARGLGRAGAFLRHLASFRFTGRVDAMLVKTLLLNQVNFQTAIATKAARLVLAAGAGTPGGMDST